MIWLDWEHYKHVRLDPEEILASTYAVLAALLDAIENDHELPVDDLRAVIVLNQIEEIGRAAAKAAAKEAAAKEEQA